MTSTEVKNRASFSGTDGTGYWVMVWREDGDRMVVVRPYVIGAAIVWKES